MILHENIIAREWEKDLLLELYNRKSSELVSITGRRRVGKTFLVDTLFAGKIDFRLAGVQRVFSGCSLLLQLPLHLRSRLKKRSMIKTPKPSSTTNYYKKSD